MCKLKLFTIQIAKLKFIFIILNNEIKIYFEISKRIKQVRLISNKLMEVGKVYLKSSLIKVSNMFSFSFNYVIS